MGTEWWVVGAVADGLTDGLVDILAVKNTVKQDSKDSVD